MTQHFSSTGVLTGSDKLIHNPDGSTSLQHLNAQNALVSADLIKAANGTVTTYHYDGIFKLLGVDIAATGSDGVVKTQSYDGSFKLLSTTIKGTAGADTLASTGGTTHLYGGAGSDTLAGNSGADYFHFDTLPDQNHSDTINGFTVGQDLIALDHSVFTALSGTGPLDSSIFVVGAKALNASQHLVYDSAHGNLYYDADGSGSQAPVLLAHIASDHALSAANILVY
jgi:Ca2+-binding RTX toxin-like protein